MENNINKLTPFKLCIIDSFPFIEEDFDAITNYQLLCKVVEYLNKTISSQNEVIQLSQELVNGYNYLLNYFENLDVQDEINNKLDEMAQDGTLSTIIGTYINPYLEAMNQTIQTKFNNQDNIINNQINRVDQLENQIDGLASGSPLVATSTAGMTDTTKIYVNTTDGNWYYYNGTEWTVGGVYQSTGIADNSITPEMIQYANIYNLYDINSIEFNKFGGNYQRLIIPAHAGQKFGSFYKYNGSIVRSYAGNGAGGVNNLLYFFNSSMTDPDNTQGRIATNINPTEDVTAPTNTAWLVFYIVNVETTPYKPNDLMLCEMTDKNADNLTYYPYGYYFKSPYILDYSDELKTRLETIESNIETPEGVYPHKNKKILGLGDSYTFLDYYGPYLEDETKVDFTPRGYNGASIKFFVDDNYTPTGGGGTIASLPITTELLNQYDAVTVMGGTNNYGQSIQPLGSLTDNVGANTVHGEIKTVINKILTLKPDMEIIWCTEPFRLSYGEQPAPGGYLPNSQGYTMQDVANAIIEECKHYGLPCYDFYSNSQWNSYSVRRENNELVENKFTYDGLHPKDGDGNGADLLGRSFGAFINTIRF